MSSPGSLYGGFIQAELEREYGRRDTINSRAATAVTSATGLVTLTTGAVALMKGQTHLLHGPAADWSIAAVLLLLLAGALAVAAGWGWGYKVVETTTMLDMINIYWNEDTGTSERTIATTNIKTLGTLRSGNNIKMWLLLGAYAVQVAAIVALAITLITVIS